MRENAKSAVEFVKMHGAGNDFVMVDDRDGRLPIDDIAWVSRLASRPDGIGCEGVIFVRRSQVADFAMRFFNPDGTEADMCGNGARCVAAFARRIGAAASDHLRFETRAGIVSADVLSPTCVRIALPDPKDLRKNFVNSGVPHAIVPVTDLAAVDVDAEGRRIRWSEAFAPAGTNVDFIHFDTAGDSASRQSPRSMLAIRTYERGVEAESFACGTGAVAAAVVGVAQYGLTFPVTVKTRRGDELTVGGRRDGDCFTDITLTGSVREVFRGTIALD